MPKPIAGRCQYCRCTEERACPDGCSWVSSRRTACTACVPGVKQLQDLFMLVKGHAHYTCPSLRQLEKWPEAVKVQAQKVLIRIHLEASDNVIPGSKPKVPKQMVPFLK